MAELIITRGLPGSGKSYAAEDWARIENNCGRPAVCISRDMIRLDVLMLGTTKGTQEQEDLVTKLQRGMVEQALCSGVSVCVDDTNLPAKRCREWADLAATCHATFSVVDYTTVPLEVCLKQNEDRIGTSKYVPSAVIRDMHARYIADGNIQPVVATVPEPVRQYIGQPGADPAYLFDIDGTLASMGDRGPFEWHKVDRDTPNEWVVELANLLYDGGYTIIALSGRDEVCRLETESWLDKYGVPYASLFMRPMYDNRKDSLVKAELFWNNVAPNWNVVGVFDDRQQVVDMWRAMGLKCAQVAPGKF